MHARVAVFDNRDVSLADELAEFVRARLPEIGGSRRHGPQIASARATSSASGNRQRHQFRYRVRSLSVRTTAAARRHCGHSGSRPSAW